MTAVVVCERFTKREINKNRTHTKRNEKTDRRVNALTTRAHWTIRPTVRGLRRQNGRHNAFTAVGLGETSQSTIRTIVPRTVLHKMIQQDYTDIEAYSRRWCIIISFYNMIKLDIIYNNTTTMTTVLTIDYINRGPIHYRFLVIRDNDVCLRTVRTRRTLRCVFSTIFFLI